jgi:BA14K-like protein
MSKHLCTLAAALVAGAAALATPTSAMPVSAALKNAAPGAVESVRWGGWGWGLGGFAAGAIIGSAIVAPRYYGGYPYGYYPAYGYPPPPPPVGYYGGPAGDGVAYCMQKYRSYDPNSGTFLGFDGARHPCP